MTICRVTYHLTMFSTRLPEGFVGISGVMVLVNNSVCEQHTTTVRNKINMVILSPLLKLSGNECSFLKLSGNYLHLNILVYDFVSHLLLALCTELTLCQIETPPANWFAVITRLICLFWTTWSLSRAADDSTLTRYVVNIRRP